LPERVISAGSAPRQAAARDLHHVSLADALELCLPYRGEPERYERAAARWIARLIAEWPGVRLAEVELAAASFREAVHSDRGSRRCGIVWQPRHVRTRRAR